MSQAKVDQYKKEKANRKETIAKEKRQKMIVKICSGVILTVLAVWIGISTVDYIIDNRPVNTIYCDTKEIDDYLEKLYDTEESTQK